MRSVVTISDLCSRPDAPRLTAAELHAIEHPPARVRLRRWVQSTAAAEIGRAVTAGLAVASWGVAIWMLLR